MSKYKVSVIIPVYNTEKYLSDTIDSVINQTIGFNNIELILVNDGSKDNSEKKCKYYEELYDNVKYFYKDNSGVSETRNVGKKLATSKYIMFLDSDDKLNNVALEKLYNFIEKNNEIDFVISRVKFFEKSEVYHYMDYRFDDGDRVVDINDDKYIKYNQYHSTGILIRKSAIEKIDYDKNVKYGEDMKFMATILLNNPKFGIVKEAILYYRKRKDESSAVNKQYSDKSWFFNTLEAYKYVLDKSKEKYKKVNNYFGFFIANSLCERFWFDLINHDELNDKEYEKYIKLLLDLYKMIPREVLCMQDRCKLDYILYVFSLLKDDKKIDIKDNIDLYNFISIVDIFKSKREYELIMSLNEKIVTDNEITINNNYLIKTNYDSKLIDLYGKSLNIDNKYRMILKYNKWYSFNNKKLIIPFTMDIKKGSLYKTNYRYLKYKKFIIRYNNKEFMVQRNNKFNTIIMLFKQSKYIIKTYGFNCYMRRLKNRVNE